MLTLRRNDSEITVPDEFEKITEQYVTRLTFIEAFVHIYGLGIMGLVLLSIFYHVYKDPTLRRFVIRVGLCPIAFFLWAFGQQRRDRYMMMMSNDRKEEMSAPERMYIDIEERLYLEAAALSETAPVDIRLILIGPSGGGKSTIGNTILNKEVFKTGSLSKSTTLECQSSKGIRFNRTIFVVDTPGLNEKNSKHVVFDAFDMATPGPHAVLFVLSAAERFTEENKRCIEQLECSLGKDLYRCMIIILSRKMNVKSNAVSFDTFIHGAPEGFRKLVRECHNRVYAFDTSDTKETPDKKIMNLIDMIEHRTQINGYFSTDKFVFS